MDSTLLIRINRLGKSPVKAALIYFGVRGASAQAGLLCVTVTKSRRGFSHNIEILLGGSRHFFLVVHLRNEGALVDLLALAGGASLALARLRRRS